MAVSHAIAERPNSWPTWSLQGIVPPLAALAALKASIAIAWLAAEAAAVTAALESA